MIGTRHRVSQSADHVLIESLGDRRLAGYSYIHKLRVFACYTRDCNVWSTSWRTKSSCSNNLKLVKNDKKWSIMVQIIKMIKNGQIGQNGQNGQNGQ